MVEVNRKEELPFQREADQNPAGISCRGQCRHLLLGMPAAGGPHCLCRIDRPDHPGPVHLQRNPAQGRPQSQSRARCREHRSTLCGAQRGPEGTPAHCLLKEVLLPDGKSGPSDELEFPLLGMAFM